MLVNGEKIFASPVAKKQDWAKNRQKMYEAGLSFLPPRAEAGLLAAHIDLQLMLPLWELSLFQVDRELKAEDIAAYTGGKMDSLVSTPVVATQTDAYVVPFSDQVVGMMMPADRQKVGRWIRDFAAVRKPELSPYMSEAYHFASEHGTPVIMALDLQDIVSYEQVRKRSMNPRSRREKTPRSSTRSPRSLRVSGASCWGSRSRTAFSARFASTSAWTPRLSPNSANPSF